MSGGDGSRSSSWLARWLPAASAPRARRALPADDWSLWHRACAGEAAAATALVQQLTPPALGLARQLLNYRHEDAEDMVQEAFLRLWSSRPSDTLGASLATFFNTIVINRCKTLLTQRRELATEPEALTELAEAQQQVGHAADGGASAQPSPAALRQALARLPARQRMAVAMWAYADASVGEIARALDLRSDNAAHQLLHRAKQALRQQALMSIKTEESQT